MAIEHVLSAQQFDPEQLETYFQAADEFRRDLTIDPGAEDLHDELVRVDEATEDLRYRWPGKAFTNLFYQESTRTRLSFGYGAKHFGMMTEGTENATLFSSAAKGETLEDTIRVINELGVKIIALRHPEGGAAEQAASVSEGAHIINGGDGQREHPTQALLDVYTIRQFKGSPEGLHYVMGGDLKRGRTIHSLARLLAHYPNVSINFVSTPEFAITDDVKQYLDSYGVPYGETSDMYGALREADVVYWTRMQNEWSKAEKTESANPQIVSMEGLRQVIQNARRRFKRPEPVELPRLGFVIDKTALDIMKDDSIIMHPLPRVGEISPTVDSDKRAVYFTQAGNGKFIRMALMDALLKSDYPRRVTHIRPLRSEIERI